MGVIFPEGLWRISGWCKSCNCSHASTQGFAETAILAQALMAEGLQQILIEDETAAKEADLDAAELAAKITALGKEMLG